MIILAREKLPDLFKAKEYKKERQMIQKIPAKAEQSTAHRSDLNASAGPVGAAIAPPNRTGLPDALKAGVETLSGLSLDDVRVHYHSSLPAGLQALAYTQGTDIHVAPGRERTLPHEAWHVVQQMQGRVRSTGSISGTPVNDSQQLEHEADRMGERAMGAPAQRSVVLSNKGRRNDPDVIQYYPAYRIETQEFQAHKLKIKGGKVIVDIEGTHGIDISFGNESHASEYFEGRKDNQSARIITMNIDESFYEQVKARVREEKSKFDKLPKPVPTSDPWVKNKEDALHFQVKWGPHIQKAIASGKIESYQQYSFGEVDESENLIVVKLKDDDAYYAWHKDYEADFKKDEDVEKIMTLMEARYQNIAYEEASISPKL